MSQQSTPAHKLLSPLEEWPVDNVAAALLRRSGAAGSGTSVPAGASESKVQVVETLGDTARVFPVASVTKPVVAYGVMLAVEEGAIELDQPAGPEGSTVRHLLAHASGVGFDSREPQKGVEKRRIYSSAGYEWLADVVAEATGMDFPEYLRLGVFEPLGMNDSQLTGSAGHALETSVNDLVAFASEVLNPTLLHPSTVEQMRTEQFPALDGIVPGYGMHKPCPWGLGFEIKGDKGRRGGDAAREAKVKPHWTSESMPASIIGHFGMSGTYLWIAPEEGYAMVALTDRDFGDWAKPLWAEDNEKIWQALAEV